MTTLTALLGLSGALGIPLRDNVFPCDGVGSVGPAGADASADVEVEVDFQSWIFALK